MYHPFFKPFEPLIGDSIISSAGNEEDIGITTFANMVCCIFAGKSVVGINPAESGLKIRVSDNNMRNFFLQ